VFRGGLSSGDFVMLGATNYVEDGSVEGTADTMPAGMMTYIAWIREGEGTKFHVLTRVNDAFGRDLEALQKRVVGGTVTGDAAMQAGVALMKQHGMYPTGSVYRNKGGGFIP
jgi:hypothetical protein